MKKDKNPGSQFVNNGVPSSSVNKALALDFAEDWRAKKQEGEWEKNLKVTLKTADPARVDLSDEFFDKIHDHVMAHVIKSEELKSCQTELSWQAAKKSKKTLSKVY